MEEGPIFLVGEKGERFFFRPEGDRIHTHKGFIDVSELSRGVGKKVKTHLGYSFVISRPTLWDIVLFGIKRKTQIVYPKDAGYIMLRLSPFPGAKVLEVGVGSGAMTILLSWFVGERGKVYGFDKREEFLELARENLVLAGLLERVELVKSDLSTVPDIEDVDILFIDVRNPREVLSNSLAKLKPSCPFSMIVPTFNQVKDTLDLLKELDVVDVEVVEILERSYKVNPERLRPKDRMVAHTGFLIFGRKAGV